MRYALRLLITTCLISALSHKTQEAPINSRHLGWDDLKHFVSFYESTNGQFKFHKNTNGTIDCGIYQVNSSHFGQCGSCDRPVALVFDSIFTRYSVGKSVSQRIVESIRNDKLNEELARSLYEMRGISEWTTYTRFKSLLVGYSYNVEMPKLRLRPNGRKG